MKARVSQSQSENVRAGFLLKFPFTLLSYPVMENGNLSKRETFHEYKTLKLTRSEEF
jgi:hypothetical protein